MKFFRITAILLFSIFTFCSSAPVEVTASEDVKNGQRLVESIQKAIEGKDRKALGEMFDDEFVFDVCGKIHSKVQSFKIIGSFDPNMIGIILSNTQFSIPGNRKILVHVQGDFFPMAAEFEISEKGKLVSGRSLSCVGKKS